MVEALSAELQNQTYGSRILLAEKLLANREIEQERRSLPLQNLPPKDPALLLIDAGKRTQRELQNLWVANMKRRMTKLHCNCVNYLMLYFKFSGFMYVLYNVFYFKFKKSNFKMHVLTLINITFKDQ